MATSQNGWEAIPSGSDKRLTTTPKIIGRVLAGDVETIFAALIAFIDKNVEDIDKGKDDWGYAYRPIAGQTSGFSNHASATAIDLNAQLHPLGAVGTWSDKEMKLINDFLRYQLDGVVRWGANYAGRKDEMHFEINASSASVKRVAERLRTGSTAQTPPVKPTQPTPKPAATYTGDSIVEYLASVGKPSSYGARAQLAARYGIKKYRGTAAQNLALLKKLRAGTTPKKPAASTYTGSSIVDYLNAINQPNSFAARAKLAKRFGIKGYIGSAKQNTVLLAKLKGK